jgi:hypothetical protein
MRMQTSVIVPIIDQNGVVPFKRKRQAPVPANVYCPMPFQIAVQWMQAPPRYVHVESGARIVQDSQLETQSGSVFWLNMSFRPGAEEVFDAFVPEALDHL